MRPKTLRLIAVVALAAPWLAAGAQAQDKTSPAWDTLAKCADMPNDADSLACFRQAMHAAGYQPAPQVASERRRRFGLNLPLIHHDHEAKPASQPAEVAQANGPVASAAPADVGENADKVSVQLSDVAVIPPANRLLLVTTDGAVWKQTDDEKVSPWPKPGQTIQIERNSFGGYFCRFDKFTKIRCTRSH